MSRSIIAIMRRNLPPPPVWTRSRLMPSPVTGQLRDAIEVGERALAGFEALGNLWWACRTIWHLQPAALALGDWGASLNYCRRALDYGATLNDRRIKVVGFWRRGAGGISVGEAVGGV